MRGGVPPADSPGMPVYQQISVFAALVAVAVAALAGPPPADARQVMVVESNEPTVR